MSCLPLLSWRRPQKSSELVSIVFFFIFNVYWVQVSKQWIMRQFNQSGKEYCVIRVRSQLDFQSYQGTLREMGNRWTRCLPGRTENPGWIAPLEDGVSTPPGRCSSIPSRNRVGKESSSELVNVHSQSEFTHEKLFKKILRGVDTRDKLKAKVRLVERFVLICVRLFYAVRTESSCVWSQSFGSSSKKRYNRMSTHFRSGPAFGLSAEVKSKVIAVTCCAKILSSVKA